MQLTLFLKPKGTPHLICHPEHSEGSQNTSLCSERRVGIRIKCFLAIIIAIFSIIKPLHAATQPKFVITPITETRFDIYGHQVLTAQYTVTNKTKITRTLTMVPIVSAITQRTSDPKDCQNPFVLSQNQSCTLTLEINGALLTEQDIHTPIKVCLKNAGNNTPDLFLCSQTDQKDNLNINIDANITSSPPPFNPLRGS